MVLTEASLVLASRALILWNRSSSSADRNGAAVPLPPPPPAEAGMTTEDETRRRRKGTNEAMIGLTTMQRGGSIYQSGSLLGAPADALNFVLGSGERGGLGLRSVAASAAVSPPLF